MLARGEREINQLLLKFVCCRFAFVFLRPPPRVFGSLWNICTSHTGEQMCLISLHRQKLSKTQYSARSTRNCQNHRFMTVYNVFLSEYEQPNDSQGTFASPWARTLKAQACQQVVATSPVLCLHPSWCVQNLFPACQISMALRAWSLPKVEHQ